MSISSKSENYKTSLSPQAQEFRSESSFVLDIMPLMLMFPWEMIQNLSEGRIELKNKL